MRRDANGIPILDALDIEDLAQNRFLKAMAPEVLEVPTFTPLGTIMGQLQDAAHVRFVLGTPLGYSPEGYKYLGCFDAVKKVILIDDSLINGDPRFPFTVAHELGHFYLHSKVRLAAIGMSESEGIRDSSRHIVIHRVSAGQPRTLLEWQANRFAGAILIPQATVRAAVEMAQQDMGINRNLGTVNVTYEQPSSYRDAEGIIARLKQIYQCSRAVVRYRLQELGLIVHRVRKQTQPQHIGDIIREMIEASRA